MQRSAKIEVNSPQQPMAYPSTSSVSSQMYKGKDFQLRPIPAQSIREITEDDEMPSSSSLPYNPRDDYDAYLEDATSVMAIHAAGGGSSSSGMKLDGTIDDAFLPTSEAELFEAFASIQASEGIAKKLPIITPKSEYNADQICAEKIEKYVKDRKVSASAFFGARVIVLEDEEEMEDHRGPPNINLEEFPILEHLDKDENKKSLMEKIREIMRITQLFPKKLEMDKAIADTQFIEDVETADWCHIHYYEFSGRVGEIFKAISPTVIIDGLCAPSDSTRLCLGAVGNPNRDPVTVAARRQIGRGCKLIYSEGNVTIESNTDAAIFIQSPIHAKSRNDHLATVYRLPSGHRMEVFNHKLFTELLEHAKTSNDFNQVYYLQTMCHVRMSFVKGWGERYRRQQITLTPCWVELHLPVPLKAVDMALKQVPGPTNESHSDT